jgi:hypothetical protein
MPDLTGNPMDDTYYLFILSNTLPYLPLIVYQDYQGNVPWSNPIQVQANGAMPDNMYWDDAEVYRLEWRKGPSDDYPLTYLIQNYIPQGEGGGSGSNTAAQTSNQITNPQFSIVNFNGTYTTTLSDAIDIAPGWTLTGNSGGGSISVTQETFTGATDDSTNASYGLTITFTGANPVTLTQTFAHNGALWAEKGVATSVSASSESTTTYISTNLTYSDSTVTTLLTQTLLTGTLTAYTSATQIPASTNTDPASTAYTQFNIVLTSPGTYTITSVQLLAQDIAEVVNYEQDTLERQTDQTFHVYRDSILLQPKDSLLAGWNFPQNPWQFTTTSSSNVAVNQYTADQTVIVQRQYVTNATQNNVATQQASAADGFGFQVTAVTGTNQFAMIQYIDTATLAPYWSSVLSSMVRLKLSSSHSTTVGVKAKLIWRTTSPTTISQTVPVASWATADTPLFSSGWTAVTPKNDPVYTLSNTADYQDIVFEGFNLPVASTSTMYAALVIYTTGDISQASTADSIFFKEVSLVPNEFAIAANTLTYEQMLRKCWFYYEKTTLPGLLPNDFSSFQGAVNIYGSVQPLAFTGVTNVFGYANSIYVRFMEYKRSQAPLFTTYSSLDGNPNNIQAVLFCNGGPVTFPGVALSGNWTQAALSNISVLYEGITASPIVSASVTNINSPYLMIRFQYSCDARLGLVT